MISLWLRVTPPSTTAQMKRVQIVRNRVGRYVPRFFHAPELEREAHTWATLLQPYVPATPMLGAVSLDVVMVYPHRKATPKRDKAKRIPKVSKPDAGNAAKHLEDILVRMRFIDDDQAVSRLSVEKWHGPADQVGIGIEIRPMAAPGGEG